MDHAEETRILGRLHRGESSRNREFERFAEARARRALRAHRRLRSVLAELARDDARVSARWAPDGATLAVECRRPSLRYRRRLVLPRWEAEFLLRTAAGARLRPE